MAGKSHRVKFNVEFTPDISTLDPYADGDAFGQVIDLTEFVQLFNHPAGVSKYDTYLEIGSIQVNDLDNQQASFDFHFRGEDFVNDTADNDPFVLQVSDVPGMRGPMKFLATGNYTEVPVGAAMYALGNAKFDRKIPLDGTKLLCKVVIRDAKTFTTTGAVSFNITGYIN